MCLCAYSGSLCVQDVGYLTELSETPTVLLPDRYRYGKCCLACAVHTAGELWTYLYCFGGFRSSCDFWSVVSPTDPCTYTLTIATPREEDWWGGHTPSREEGTVEAPELGYPCVTVGEHTTTWDALHHRDALHSSDALHHRDALHPSDALHHMDALHHRDALPHRDALHPSDALCHHHNDRQE